MMYGDRDWGWIWYQLIRSFQAMEEECFGTLKNISALTFLCACTRIWGFTDIDDMSSKAGTGCRMGSIYVNWWGLVRTGIAPKWTLLICTLPSVGRIKTVTLSQSRSIDKPRISARTSNLQLGLQIRRFKPCSRPANHKRHQKKKLFQPTAHASISSHI